MGDSARTPLNGVSTQYCSVSINSPFALRYRMAYCQQQQRNTEAKKLCVDDAKNEADLLQTKILQS